MSVYNRQRSSVHLSGKIVNFDASCMYSSPGHRSYFLDKEALGS
jgi:hypothetical protein